MGIFCLCKFSSMKRKCSTECRPDSKINKMSIRERFRYFKKKSETPIWPKTTGFIQKQFCQDLLNSTSNVKHFPNGAILFKRLINDIFLEKLATEVIYDYPFRRDSITNIEKLGKPLNKDITDKFTANSNLMASSLKELRWTTLGYHHNWDSKQYESKNSGSMPSTLIEIGNVVSCLVESNYNPQAAICNYYPAGVGTIGIHTDNSGY